MICQASRLTYDSSVLIFKNIFIPDIEDILTKFNKPYRIKVLHNLLKCILVRSRQEFIDNNMKHNEFLRLACLYSDYQGIRYILNTNI